jgi:hypothetical protein
MRAEPWSNARPRRSASIGLATRFLPKKTQFSAKITGLFGSLAPPSKTICGAIPPDEQGLNPYRVAYVMKYVRFSSSIARFTLLTTTCGGTCKINGEKLSIAWMPASTS